MYNIILQPNALLILITMLQPVENHLFISNYCEREAFVRVEFDMRTDILGACMLKSRCSFL